MIWMGTCYIGVTKIIFIEEKINSDNYIEKILPTALEECNKLLGSNWMFQQDGATAHT